VQNAVVISGANALLSVIQALSVKLQAASTPITIIYENTTSCTGFSDVTGQTVEKTTPATVWDAGGNANTCDVDPINGIAVDIGVSDVFAQTCVDEGALTSIPATGFGDFIGPSQAMSFIVATASNEASISAEAAFAVLGWGGSGQYPVSPWTASPNTSVANVFIRNNTAGVEDLIAKDIGLTASKWKGTPEAKNSNVIAAVASSSAPQAAIGVVASEVAQAATGVKLLAYQAAGQACGYLPDSTASGTGSRDKLNLREGRYDLWGPTHFLSAVDGSGVPTSAKVKIFTDAVTFVTPNSADAQAIIVAEAQTGVVPACAMKVSRAAEQGAESSVQPSGDCSCFFDETVSGGNSCQACTGDGDCADAGAATHCNYGYCEVQ
jgi:hypothetical protein